MMRTQIFLVCLLLLAQTISALGDCVEVPGQSLTSVTFDFTKTVASSDQIDVNCDVIDRQKSCCCEMQQLAYAGDLHKPMIFNMQPGGDGIGFLKGPGGNLGAALRCAQRHEGTRTPTVTMLRGILSYNPSMLKSCTFTNRAKYPDEVKQTNTEPSKSGASTSEDRKLIVDALNTAGGDKAEAAKKLGISEKALLRKMREYKIVTVAQ